MKFAKTNKLLDLNISFEDLNKIKTEAKLKVI